MELGLVCNVIQVSCVQHCISASVHTAVCSPPKIGFLSTIVQLIPFTRLALFPAPPCLVTVNGVLCIYMLLFFWLSSFIIFCLFFVCHT